jgi:hypothetical protein
VNRLVTIHRGYAAFIQLPVIHDFRLYLLDYIAGSIVLVKMAIICGFSAAGPTFGPATVPSSSCAGNWKWTFHMDEMTIPATAKLTQDGNSVNGLVYSGMDQIGLKVTDGNIDGDKISFKTDRVEEQGTQECKYKGTLDGNTIKGKIQISWVDVPGHAGEVDLDWNAVRVKDDGK